MTASTMAVPGGAPPITPEPTLGTVLRWEIVKLAAQARFRYTLLACVIVPVALVLIFNAQQTSPSDTIFGIQVHTSGFSMPLFILTFGSQWIFPALAAIVGGDIFAHEDGHGTWKTILTRSVGRGRIFWAKTLTAAGFTLVSLIVLGASSIASSLLIIGRQPLVGLTGQTIPAGHALTLVCEAWAVTIPPMLGFTALAILLSIRTRNPAAGVAIPVALALIMQLLGSIGGIDLTRRFLLTTPMETWLGLMSAHQFFGPLRFGLAVSAGWIAVSLAVAYYSLRRRDITGG